MIVPQIPPYTDRIALNTDQRRPNQCWEWLGCCYTDGYPRVVWHGKQLRVIRIVWEWENGQDIPDGMVIRHTCDNPICVNPRHLLLGTPADNMEDRDCRGRHWVQSGTNHYRSHLTSDQIRAIFQYQDDNYSRVARLFGVNRMTVARIKQRKRYSEITDDLT